jgi:hypothetical protein
MVSSKGQTLKTETKGIVDSLHLEGMIGRTETIEITGITTIGTEIAVFLKKVIIEKEINS